MTIRSILPALCILLISCGKKPGIPAEIIRPSKMQLVFWDYIRADALATQQQKSSTSPEAMTANVKLQKQVFALYHITKEEFYKSLDYYKAHPALMKTLLDSVVEKANRERPNNTGVVYPAMIK